VLLNELVPGPRGCTGLEWEDVMKRSLMLAIAGLAVTGCYTSSTSYDNVLVSWQFTHFDFTGTNQPLTCAQAGVDGVLIEFSDGYSLTASCSQSGVPVPGFAPGLYTVAVTGFRTGQIAPLYYGTANFTKFAGADAVVDVAAPGIFSDLVLQPVLNGWNGSAYTPYTSPACSNALIDHVSYEVRDGANVILATGQVPCLTNPPAISFLGTNGIDKDNLSIRLQGKYLGAVVMDSCNGTTSYPHFLGSDSFTIDLFGNPVPGTCP
jgi:hypothetical protein